MTPVSSTPSQPLTLPPYPYYTEGENLIILYLLKKKKEVREKRKN
jgi:hypothetical protein